MLHVPDADLRLQVQEMRCYRFRPPSLRDICVGFIVETKCKQNNEGDTKKYNTIQHKKIQYKKTREYKLYIHISLSIFSSLYRYRLLRKRDRLLQVRGTRDEVVQVEGESP